MLAFAFDLEIVKPCNCSADLAMAMAIAVVASSFDQMLLGTFSIWKLKFRVYGSSYLSCTERWVMLC